MTETTANTSRRTVAKGVAWSVPVVVAAAYAPAANASGVCVGTLCFGDTEVFKCCPPGALPNFYWARVTFTNTGTVAVTATFSFTVTPAASPPVTFSGSGIVLPGQTRTFLIRGSTVPENCANATYPTFTITFTDGTTTGSVQIPAGSTGGNSCDGAPARRAEMRRSQPRSGRRGWQGRLSPHLRRGRLAGPFFLMGQHRAL